MPAATAPTQLDDALLDAAHRAIEEHGWANATLERIAAAAGVSRMTLHRHGVSRAAVLAGLTRRLEAEHRDAMLEVLAAPGDARTRLRAAIDAECALNERNLALFDAFGAAGRDAVYHENDERGLTREEFAGPYRRLLEDGASDGSLRAVDDPEETATVLLNLVGHTYRHLRLGHGWKPARAREAVSGVALDGVRA